MTKMSDEMRASVRKERKRAEEEMTSNIVHLEPPTAQDQGEQARDQQHRPIAAVLPSPSEPMMVARTFVTQNFLEDGELSLRYWGDGWWDWRRSHWQEVEYRAIKSSLYRFTEHACYMVNHLRVR